MRVRGMDHEGGGDAVNLPSCKYQIFGCTLEEWPVCWKYGRFVCADVISQGKCPEGLSEKNQRPEVFS